MSYCKFHTLLFSDSDTVIAVCVFTKCKEVNRGRSKFGRILYIIVLFICMVLMQHNLYCKYTFF